MPKVHECPNCDANLRPYQETCAHCGAPLDWSDVTPPPRPMSKSELEDDVFEEPTTIRIRTDVLTRTGYEFEDEKEEPATDMWTGLERAAESRTYPDYMRKRKKKVLAKSVGMTALLIVFMLGLAILISPMFPMNNIQVETEPDIVGITISAQVDVWKNAVEMVGFPEKQVTNVAIDYIRHLLQIGSWFEVAISPFKYLGIGIGELVDADFTKTNVTLDDEFDRIEAISTTRQFNEFLLTVSWSAGSFDGETITEVGVFNQGTGGIMLLYQTISAGITLYSGDSLRIDITVTIGE